MKSTTQLSVPEMIALIISVISLVISIIALVINIIKTRITIKEYKKSEASGTSESKSELKGVLEKVRELPDIDLEFHNRENFITMSKYLIEKIDKVKMLILENHKSALLPPGAWLLPVICILTGWLERPRKALTLSEGKLSFLTR